MKIGILLGSFDPIHNGHLSMVAEALNNRGIDKVILVPAWQNPWKKQSIAPYQKRYTMTLFGVKFLQHCVPAWANTIDVSNIEWRLANETNTEPVYSDMTFKALMQELGNENDYYFICGSDVAHTVPSWHNGQWIIDNIQILEIDRPGVGDKSSHCSINVSSTVIRGMLVAHKAPIPYLPLNVWTYIKINNLYINEKSNLNENSNGTDC